MASKAIEALRREFTVTTGELTYIPNGDQAGRINQQYQAWIEARCVERDAALLAEREKNHKLVEAMEEVGAECREVAETDNVTEAERRAWLAVAHIVYHALLEGKE